MNRDPSTVDRESVNVTLSDLGRRSTQIVRVSDSEQASPSVIQDDQSEDIIAMKFQYQTYEQFADNRQELDDYV